MGTEKLLRWKVSNSLFNFSSHILSSYVKQKNYKFTKKQTLHDKVGEEKRSDKLEDLKQVEKQNTATDVIKEMTNEMLNLALSQDS